MKFWKPIISVFIILIFIQGSCRKDKDCLCGIENPRTNLIWLKDRLDRMLCVEVYSLIYERKEYVIISDCPGPDSQAVFYDCVGNKTCELGGISYAGGNCYMPEGFTFEFYFSNRKFMFSQSSKSPNQ